MPDFELKMEQDIKKLAKEYAFLPANTASGFQRGTDWAETDMGGGFAGFRHISMDPRKVVVRLRVKLNNTDRGELLQVAPALDDDNGVPAYFLPWDGRGAAVTMRIPDLDTSLPERVHPKIFFTAVLSGCTIVFKGTSTNPRIYHCGTQGATGGGAPTVGDSNQFFLNLLQAAQANGIGSALPVGSVVNSRDYMDARGGGNGVRQQEDALMRQINNKLGKKLVVRMVVSWGAVFGVRTGRDWKFYLQHNATIQYQPLRSALGKFCKWVDTTVRKKDVPDLRGKQVARPMSVQRVFPGHGTVKMVNTWKLIQV